MMTAEEFWLSKHKWAWNSDSSKKMNQGVVKDVAEAMKEYTKFHVEAALKAAAENSVKMSSTKETILRSYPLTNIK